VRPTNRSFARQPASAEHVACRAPGRCVDPLATTERVAFCIPAFHIHHVPRSQRLTGAGWIRSSRNHAKHPLRTGTVVLVKAQTSLITAWTFVPSIIETVCLTGRCSPDIVAKQAIDSLVTAESNLSFMQASPTMFSGDSGLR